MAAVALVACEDTRRTGLLLSKHGIDNPGMVVMNEHSERRASERILSVLHSGESVAIVTDAGMPVISDPGALAVATAAEAGFEVVVVPGPTAVSSAIALSGFASGRYVFEGFLPRKGKERTQAIEDVAAERRMVVFYEAPHRIERTLQELAVAMDPARKCVVARELTKLHEEVWRGVLGDAAAAHSDPRGEYVIVIDQSAPLAEATDEVLLQALEQAVSNGASKKDAAATVATAHRAGRNRVYALANQLRS